jgi:hypothetical protein
MSAIETKALSAPLPKAVADSTSKTGTHRYASSASNTAVAIPSAWKGKWITVMSDGVDTQFAYGTSSPTLVYNQAAAIGTGHASAGTTCKDGVARDFLIPREATHLAWISSGTGGFFELYLSELNRVGNKG